MGIKPNPVHPNLHNDKFGIFEKRPQAINGLGPLHNDKFGIFEKRPQAINGLGPSLLYINFKWKK